jgi:uncharacterized membrane protein
MRRIVKSGSKGEIDMNKVELNKNVTLGANKTNFEKIRWLVMLAMWTALTWLLAFVPFLGYINIGPFSITTVHIPVIIGAIMLGPAAGAFLGGMFGLTSIIQATLQAPITAFIFSPVVPFGNFNSILVAMVPRILVGIVAAYVYKFIKIKDKSGYFATLAAAILGALTNTIFVLGGAYLLFGPKFASAQKIPFNTLFKVLLGVVATNGIFEAVFAAVVVTAVTKALFAVMKRQH